MSDAKNRGSVSDPNNFLEAMVLAYEVENGVHSFGFYRSKEGREFLRQLFQPYLRRQSMGEGKAATIIADSYRDNDLQKREVGKTKSALRRWRKDSQNELWPKDERKNLRCLRRLENEFLANQELREVMEDTAETVQKHQTGIAFANFFYGALPVQKKDTDIEALHLQFEGIHHAQRLIFLKGNDPFEEIKADVVAQLVKEVRSKGLAPNTIELDPNSFDMDKAFVDTREPVGFVTDKSDTESYFYLSSVDHRNFMLAQEFELAFDKENEPCLRNLSIGYAYPMLNGTLHMFMTETVPPSRKSYLAFSPDSTLRPINVNRNVGDRYWRVVRQPFAEAWEGMIHATENVYWKKVNPEDRRFHYLNVDKISVILDRSKWNLIP